MFLFFLLLYVHLVRMNNIDLIFTNVETVIYDSNRMLIYRGTFNSKDQLKNLRSKFPAPSLSKQMNVFSINGLTHICATDDSHAIKFNLHLTQVHKHENITANSIKAYNEGEDVSYQFKLTKSSTNNYTVRIAKQLKSNDLIKGKQNHTVYMWIRTRNWIICRFRVNFDDSPCDKQKQKRNENQADINAAFCFYDVSATIPMLRTELDLVYNQVLNKVITTNIESSTPTEAKQDDTSISSSTSNIILTSENPSTIFQQLTEKQRNVASTFAVTSETRYQSTEEQTTFILTSEALYQTTGEEQTPFTMTSETLYQSTEEEQMTFAVTSEARYQLTEEEQTIFTMTSETLYQSTEEQQSGASTSTQTPIYISTIFHQPTEEHHIDTSTSSTPILDKITKNLSIMPNAITIVNFNKTTIAQSVSKSPGNITQSGSNPPKNASNSKPKLNKTSVPQQINKPPKKSETNSFFAREKIILFILIFLFLLIISTVIIYIYKQKKKNDGQEDEEEEIENIKSKNGSDTSIVSSGASEASLSSKKSRNHSVKNYYGDDYE